LFNGNSWKPRHQEATAIAKATAVLNSDAAFATFGQVTGGAPPKGTKVVLHSFFYIIIGVLLG
jgi:hypothetical protein